MSRRTFLLLGLAATVGFTALWHGPLGAGERLATETETRARQTLDYYELPMIQAKLQRGPLSRRLVLTEVDLAPDGPTVFPVVEPGRWREVSRVPGEAPVDAWVTWERR